MPDAMGQPITVVAKPSSTRPTSCASRSTARSPAWATSATVAGQTIDDHRPVDELARRLFERGGIDAVHINGSVVTVDLAKGGSADGLDRHHPRAVHLLPRAERRGPAAR